MVNITWAWCYDAYEKGCEHQECPKHPINQQERYVTHSYKSYRGTAECEERKEKEKGGRLD